MAARLFLMRASAVPGIVTPNPRYFDPAKWHATVYPTEDWIVYGKWGESQLNKACIIAQMKSHWRGDVVIGRADGELFQLSDFIDAEEDWVTLTKLNTGALIEIPGIEGSTH